MQISKLLSFVRMNNPYVYSVLASAVALQNDQIQQLACETEKVLI